MHDPVTQNDERMLSPVSPPVSIIALLLSVGLGYGWHTLVQTLMGVDLRTMHDPAWVLAGLLAGLAYGLVAPARRGRGKIRHVVGTYLLSIFVYWAVHLIIARVILCLHAGGWTDFDLHDQLMIIFVFLIPGTVAYGVVLLPLAMLSRWLVWRVYLRCV